MKTFPNLIILINSTSIGGWGGKFKMIIFDRVSLVQGTLSRTLIDTLVPKITILGGTSECPLLAYSAKKCDNLLVEADLFYHFRELILCNSKRLQFHWKKNMVAQFSKSSIQLCLHFFNLMKLLVPFASHKKLYHYDGSILIFDSCWVKIFLHKLAFVSRSSIWEKSGAPIFHI